MASSSCCMRAIWILNNNDVVLFSRRFPVVERRWRIAFNKESGSLDPPLLPTDSELSAAFVDRKKKEGSARGYGIRIAQSAEGSDSWVDDPITRHIISLNIKKDEDDEEDGGGGDKETYLLWPLILHIKSHYSILVLPLVEPQHLKAYERISNRPGCGSAVGVDESVSSLLLELPSITG